MYNFFFSVRKVYLFFHNLLVAVVRNGVANFIKEVHKRILPITPILQRTTEILMNEILCNNEKHQRKRVSCRYALVVIAFSVDFYSFCNIIRTISCSKCDFFLGGWVCASKVAFRAQVSLCHDEHWPRQNFLTLSTFDQREENWCI